MKVVLGWVLGDQSSETFRPVWAIVATWQCDISPNQVTVY